MPKSYNPLVSIILPTYNRASFLPEAFEAIKKQSFEDWELIVVDDGSTDNTRELVKDFASHVSQKVQYIYQKNQGPAAARNKGLNYAKGKYIAFYDSDDIWLPNYLNVCICALENYKEIDWIFTACRLIKMPSGEVFNSNHLFRPDGRPRMVLNIKTIKCNNVYIIQSNKEAIKCALLEGLQAGLQHSVIKREVFLKCKLNSKYHVGEDQILVVEALKSDFKFAFLKDVYVIYRMHEDNISCANLAKDFENKVETYIHFIEALLSLKPILGFRERFYLFQRVSSIYFWNIFYGFYELGAYDQAFPFLKKALKYQPWSRVYWKYLFILILKLFNELNF